MSRRIFLIHFILTAVLLLQVTGLCFADAQSQFDTAEKFYDQKEYVKAEQAYQAVLDNWPDADCAIWAQTGIAKSRVYLAGIFLGSFEDANTAVGKLIANFAQNPELAIAVFTVADEYRKIGKYDKAKPLYQYVVDNFSIIEQPSRSQILAVIMSNVALDKSDAAQAAIDMMIDLFHEDEQIGEAVYRIAEEYYDLDDFKKAIEYYQLILDNWPDSEYAIWGQEGIVLSNICLDNLHRAQTAIEKLVADFNNHSALPEALYGIARRFNELSKYEHAADVYQQIIQQYPDSSYAEKANVEVSKFETWLYIRAADDSNAAAATEKLIADFNGHPDLSRVIFLSGKEYYQQGLKYDKEGNKDQAKVYFQKALDLWERIIQEFPESTTTPQACNWMAHCCFEHLGEYQKAIDSCQKVVINWPDYEYVWHAQFLVGNYYERLTYAGLIPESEATPIIEQAYKAVVEKYPDCSKFKYASLKLAELNFERKQWTEAAMYYELFLTEFTKSNRPSSILYSLGQAYDNMGQVDEATRSYNDFLRRASPGDPRVESVKRRIEELIGPVAKAKSILSDIELRTVYGGCELCGSTTSTHGNCTVASNGGVCDDEGDSAVCTWLGGCDCKVTGKHCFDYEFGFDNCVNTSRSCPTTSECTASFCYKFGDECLYSTTTRSCNLDNRPHCY